MTNNTPMTETLTEEDRKQLLSFGDYGEHAVTIIDRDAAALARVRDVQVEHHSRVGYYVPLESLKEALAGAGAPVAARKAGPTYSELFGMVSELQTSERILKRERDAALARVAELEADVCERETHRDLAEAARDVANARAEAAELSVGQLTNDNNLWQAKWLGEKQRAESEAASLRAELERLREKLSLTEARLLEALNDQRI